MSGATPKPADAAAGLQVLAEVIERGLNIVERDCEVFVQPVPTGAEIQMMVKRQDVSDIRAVLSERAAHKQAVEALREIDSLQPQQYAFPPDWHEQIEGCSECLRYKGHPIQQGICDTHRRPLWDRERHDESERRAIGPRAQRIARAALAAVDEASRG